MTTTQPMHKRLRAELLDMLKSDQEVRRALAAAAQHDPEFGAELDRRNSPDMSNIGVLTWDSPDVPKVIRDMWDTDHRNLIRLHELIEEHGWPSRKLVGVDGLDAAWLLILHADTDRAFQKRCLSLMKQAPVEDVDMRQIAWLNDRLLIADGRAQLFGTILVAGENGVSPYRLAEPARVNERRAQMGLPALEYSIEQDAMGVSQLPMSSWNSEASD